MPPSSSRAPQVRSIRKLLQSKQPGQQQLLALGQTGRSGVRGGVASATDPRAFLVPRVSFKPEVASPAAAHAAAMPSPGGYHQGPGREEGATVVDVERLLRDAMEKALAAALAGGAAAGSSAAAAGAARQQV